MIVTATFTDELKITDGFFTSGGYEMDDELDGGLNDELDEIVIELTLQYQTLPSSSFVSSSLS